MSSSSTSCETSTSNTRPSSRKPSANSSYLFRNTFENGVEDWTARGSNTLGLSGRTAFAGKNALLVSKRTSSWNGAQKSLSTSTFVPGNTYGFSAYVNYLDGNTNSSTFNLTLQYKDSTGTIKYSNIATKSVTKGTYTKLVNSNYKIPSGASDIHLIVETSKDTMNFYVDEVIGAKAGQL